MVGAACALGGLLPRAETTATLHRILPLLLFLGTVIVLAELTAVAGVFDVLASRLAIAWRGGGAAALFLLCGGLATLTTLVLNLDTTAVLLTPVLLALARSLRVAAAPLAVTTVWLANTASLLLPVSNLTNLLAADRVGLAPAGVRRPDGAAAAGRGAVTMALLWWALVARGTARPRPLRPARRRARRTRCCTAPRSPAACSSSPGSSPAWRSPSPRPSRVAAGAGRVRRPLPRDAAPGAGAACGCCSSSPACSWWCRPSAGTGWTTWSRALLGADGGALGALRAGGTGAVLANAREQPAGLPGRRVGAADR